MEEANRNRKKNIYFEYILYRGLSFKKSPIYGWKKNGIDSKEIDKILKNKNKIKNQIVDYYNKYNNNNDNNIDNIYFQKINCPSCKNITGCGGGAIDSSIDNDIDEIERFMYCNKKDEIKEIFKKLDLKLKNQNNIDNIIKDGKEILLKLFVN